MFLLDPKCTLHNDQNEVSHYNVFVFFFVKIAL